MTQARYTGRMLKKDNSKYSKGTSIVPSMSPSKSVAPSVSVSAAPCKSYDSLVDLDRTDDFESKYNFRFEEANENEDITSGAGMSFLKRRIFETICKSEAHGTIH